MQREQRREAASQGSKAGDLSSMDLPTMVLEVAKLVGLPDNGVASLVLTESDRGFRDLTKGLHIVKDGGAKRLQSFLQSQGMDLGVFSRIFSGGYGSQNQSQYSISSHRLSEA